MGRSSACLLYATTGRVKAADHPISKICSHFQIGIYDTHSRVAAQKRGRTVLTARVRFSEYPALFSPAQAQFSAQKPMSSNPALLWEFSTDWLRLASYGSPFEPAQMHSEEQYARRAFKAGAASHSRKIAPEETRRQCARSRAEQERK